MKQTNLEMILGDTWEKSISFTDAANAPINITGAIIVFTIKKEPSDTALVQKTVTNHVNPTGGQSAVEITPADWTGVVAGSYVYDMQITFVDGKKYTVMRGQVTVIDDISKI